MVRAQAAQEFRQGMFSMKVFISGTGEMTQWAMGLSLKYEGSGSQHPHKEPDVASLTCNLSLGVGEGEEIKTRWSGIE